MNSVEFLYSAELGEEKIEGRLRTQSRGKDKVGRAERKKETDVGTLQAVMDYGVGFK